MKTGNTYKLPVDDTFFAYSVLNMLDAGKVDTFEQRLKSQKVQYLAQAFGVSPSYGFSLYLHGPYSPDLTSDLFALKEQKIKVDSSEFISESFKEKFKKLSSFISGKDNRKLELVATLHLFIKVLNLKKEEAVKKLIELKNASQSDVDYAFKQLDLIP